MSHAHLAAPAVARQPETSPLRLGDVHDVVEAHPAYTAPAVRALINRAGENGLAPHIYRVGRRVLIDLPGFEAWVREKQLSQTA